MMLLYDFALKRFYHHLKLNISISFPIILISIRSDSSPYLTFKKISICASDKNMHVVMENVLSDPTKFRSASDKNM
jgi:hypothetical protein